MPKAHNYPLTRQEIIRKLVDTFEPNDNIYAMWEGGAAANNRVDQWSDIDIQIVVADEFADEAMLLAEKTLLEISPISRKLVIAQPTWHGHLQTFYQLANASPFNQIDFVVMKHSNPNKFIEREIHGNACVYFDKLNIIITDPLSVDEMVEKILKRKYYLENAFEISQIHIEKEINRDHLIEALVNFQAFTLRPLIEILRMIHKPWQYNFPTRYIYTEFPHEIINTLEDLYHPKDLQDLKNKHMQAIELFREFSSLVNRQILINTLSQQQAN